MDGDFHWFVCDDAVCDVGFGYSDGLVERMVSADACDLANVGVFDPLYPSVCVRFASRRQAILVDGSDGELGRIQESWHRLVFVSLVISKKYLYVFLSDIDDCVFSV